MKKLMTWTEVLGLDLENMSKVAAEIDAIPADASDACARVARLNERLANASSHYENHKAALEAGLQCNYFRTTAK